LKQLADKSRKTVNSIIKNDLPPIERNLEQIEKQSRKLADRVIRLGENTERKTPFFLANIGIDGDKLAQDLNSINIFNTFEPRIVLSDTDVEKYLDHNHQKAFTETIKDGHTQTINECNSLYDKLLIKDWANTKKQAFGELGQFNVSSSSSSQIQRSYIPITGHHSSIKSTINLNQRHMVYFDIVVKLNDSRLFDRDYGVISEFFLASKKISMDYSKKLIDCWQALKHIVGEHNVIEGTFRRNALKQRCFAQVYETPLQNPLYKELCKSFINGAKKYLEEIYCTWSRDMIDSFRNEAMMGGQPSAINMALGLLRVIHRLNGGISTQNLEIVENNIPIWGLLYVLMRQGHYDHALEAIEKYARYFLVEDSLLLTNFKRSSTIRRIASKTTNLHSFSFNRRSFVLCCIREIESIQDGSSDTVTLSGFQKEISTFGPNYFTSNGKDPIQYFRALLLSLQFERAIDYLLQTDYKEDAVHFAITLAYYGLLRVPEDGESLALFFEKKENDSNQVVAKFNFNKLIVQYVHMLISDHDNIATHSLHYLLLLYLYGNHRDDFGRYQIEINHDHMRHLVLETNAGLMRKYMKLMFINDEKEFKEKIINMLARQFFDDGKFNAARRLYEITENYEECVALLNKILAEYIWIVMSGVPVQPDTEIEFNPNEVARISKEYEQLHYTNNVSANLLNDNKTLLKLVEFVELYKQQDYGRAVSSIKKIDLFPFVDDISIIMEKANAINGIDESLKKSITELLYITMKCIVHHQQHLKDQLIHGTPGLKIVNDSELYELQRNAKALVTFAGYVQNRSANEINRKKYRSINQINQIFI
ncbi:8375_t:CDS:10, partial [Entrophospora sp. SA101]